MYSSALRLLSWLPHFYGDQRSGYPVSNTAAAFVKARRIHAS
ncbi:hypothetical protein SAMCCGM7_pB0285 (plasmid) [Sinorhizobium americanum CCGM7]|nr:hypothetical protein SAMCCGM7_pB0285 [Sinorhizobium americanum CCGM7]